MNRLLMSSIFLFFSLSLFAMGPQSPGGMRYDHIDPDGVVPSRALDLALDYYERNFDRIRNKRYLSVLDFSQHSRNRRFYLINMETGKVSRYLVAHGKGSDYNHDGYADRFSNQHGSKASSLGFYRTAETYYGGNGYSLRLDGLSSSNSRARSRAVVIHGADYVHPSRSKMGRSHGCPAFEMRHYRSIINRIKGGSIIFAWNG